MVCPKRTRQSNERELMEAKESASPSADDQRRMIDRFVERGLARYLDRAHDESTRNEGDKLEETNADRDFRQLLYDWAMTNENKRKRTCEAERFTTPKPGSIIVDSIPVEKVVLLEAPYMDESLQSNLSDKAFQEAGDTVGGGIDTSQQKIYKGVQAVDLIEKLTHRNLTTTSRPISDEGSDESAVDIAPERKR